MEGEYVYNELLKASTYVKMNGELSSISNFGFILFY